MDVYFANKQCSKYCKINLPTTVKTVQQQNNRPRSAMKAAEIDFKDQIKISFKAVAVPRVKANPNLFLANLQTLLTNNRPMGIEYLDDMLAKNQKKRSDYGTITEIANLNSNDVLTNNSQKRIPINFPPEPAFLPLELPTSPTSPPLRSNVPFDPDIHSGWNSKNHDNKFNLPQYHRPNSLPSTTGYSIVDELMNLTGMDRGKATRYLQRHGTVEKAYKAFEHEKASVMEFMRRQRVNQSQAEFLLQSTNFNMSEASNLFKQMRR